MKRILMLIGAVALVASTVACQKEIQGPEEYPLTVTAEFESPTKTMLQDGGSVVYWEANEEIKIFYADGYGRFVSKNTAPAKKTSFSGTINVVVGGGEDFEGGEQMWAVYPYGTDVTYDGSSVTATIASEQTGRAGSFGKGANVSVAKSGNLGLAFYNVCGGLRFCLTQEGINEVIFKGQNDEILAGKAKITFENGVPVVKEVADGQKSITLTAPGGGVFETGKWYYIIALPVKLTNGFQLTFNTEKETAVLRSSRSVEIKRSVFGSLDEADKDLIFKDKGNPEPSGDFIEFKDPAAKLACLFKFDKDDDGEISYDEAAAVTSIEGLFTEFNTVTSFDELRYFTKLTSIGTAFTGLKSLQSVTIPVAVTSLVNDAFSRCSALETVTFDGTALKTIGSYAFQYCTSLKTLELPSSVTVINSYAFNGCSALESLQIPAQVTTIQNSCFADCSSLKSIWLPSGLKTIGTSAFDGCGSMESIDLPVGMTTIDAYAFYHCSSLRSVVVPDSVISFGGSVFSVCTSLESAVLPSGLNRIPDYTFYGCSNLVNFVFPDSVTEIGAYAFYRCRLLNNGIPTIEIPKSVTTIGASAFTGLINVIIPASKPVSIGSGTFSAMTKIYVPSSLVSVYKVMSNWSAYSDNIFPISDYDDSDYSVSTDLSAEGTANCYIVSKGGSYKFKTVCGNTATSVGDVACAEVLWETFGTNVQPNVGDLVFSVKYEDDYIRFNATPLKGNAVIAAKDDDGNILWSWHIWFTDQPESQVYYNNAGTVMDRNLGATSATKGDVKALGLLYQWGRKDPFLGGQSISYSSSSYQTTAKSTITWPSTVSSDSSNGTIDFVVKHPTTFVTYNSSNYDWYYTGGSSTDNTRWNSSKGMYDPCPKGWRVPDGGSNGLWAKAFGTSSYWTTSSNWDSTNKGMDFGSTDKKLGSGEIWYPASGYLFSNDGALLYVGYVGYYWSCTPNGSFAYYLYFDCNGRVDPSDNYYRAYGQSVRCLQE